jgi:hypothetical protein
VLSVITFWEHLSDFETACLQQLFFTRILIFVVSIIVGAFAHLRIDPESLTLQSPDSIVKHVESGVSSMYDAQIGLITTPSKPLFFCSSSKGSQTTHLPYSYLPVSRRILNNMRMNTTSALCSDGVRPLRQLFLLVTRLYSIVNS